MNVIEKYKSINGDKKIADFIVKQKQDYEFKKNYAYARAWEFFNILRKQLQEVNTKSSNAKKRGLNCHVSVGGLDSITLYLFLKEIGINVPGISVSYLEDMSIQKIHKELGIDRLKSAKKKDGTHWNKQNIIQEFGFPVLSKEIAAKIMQLQNPTDKNTTIRHAIITGETGEYGGFRKNTKMKLSQCWLEKFGGYENKNENVNYQKPDFKVSSKCCYYLKEKPCDDWAKENNSVPFLGMMASEGGRRSKSLMINGCNYFGKSVIRSAPFAIFNRQDILKLALELDVTIPAIYGTIEKDINGNLFTTKAQRTGCSMCGFGIQLEKKRPHRFDRLYETNQKEWEYWMKSCYKNDNGEVFGWGKVLDYIGVKWKHEQKQMSIFELGGEII